VIKRIGFFVGALILVGVGFGAYMWFKPHPKVENAKAIQTTAINLSKEYAADEAAANAKYLSSDKSKAIEVVGNVAEVTKNQDGGIMIVLDTGDPMAGVQCTMREKTATSAVGNQVTILGYCTGNGITGVTLTDCVLK
jgi:hypothetical protein